MISKELWTRVVDGSREARKFLCERSFACFCLYYFSDFFIYALAEFHWQMILEIEAFTRGEIKFLMWIMFRESAKTSFAKMYVIYCIAYRKKRFINYDSYDKANSEAALFDVASWLQTNRRIIADFGQLFVEDRSSKQATMKRISEFVTTNKVKVKAYSTQESTRGRIFDRFRPDLYIVDDFETEITAKSAPVTQKIIAHIDGMKSGIATDGQVIFLGNLISETGSVATLIHESKENPDAWHYHRVDVEEKGKIMWPDKYVWTNADAAKLNAMIPDPKQRKVSLEQKRKDLNAGGRKVYEAEMLNSPEAAGEPFFNRERVDAYIAKNKKPLKIVGGLSVYEDYLARHRYAFGGDTSKGVGRDACASAGIRFSPMDRTPALVVGTYTNNTIPPDLFGDEMAAHGRLFGECLLAPELNNTGFATVTRLKAIYPSHKIYRQIREDQLGKNITKDLGWEATSANVATIYFNFRSAFDLGEIEVFCPALLAEIRAFTKRDLEEASRRSETPQAGVITRHFDLLRAVCIAWEMRTHATAAKKEAGYKQEAHQGRSEYQG